MKKQSPTASTTIVSGEVFVIVYDASFASSFARHKQKLCSINKTEPARPLCTVHLMWKLSHFIDIIYRYYRSCFTSRTHTGSTENAAQGFDICCCGKGLCGCVTTDERANEDEKLALAMYLNIESDCAMRCVWVCVCVFLRFWETPETQYVLRCRFVKRKLNHTPGQYAVVSVWKTEEKRKMSRVPGFLCARWQRKPQFNEKHTKDTKVRSAVQWLMNLMYGFGINFSRVLVCVIKSGLVGKVTDGLQHVLYLNI